MVTEMNIIRSRGNGHRNEHNQVPKKRSQKLTQSGPKEKVTEMNTLRSEGKGHRNEHNTSGPEKNVTEMNKMRP